MNNALLVKVIEYLKYLGEIVLHDLVLSGLKFRTVVDQFDQFEEISIAPQLQYQAHQPLPPHHLPQLHYSRVPQPFQHVGLGHHLMHFVQLVYLAQVDHF